MTSPPPPEVLTAFGVEAEPRLLDGGRGLTWRADDVVLKPVDDAAEHAWTCAVYDAWADERVAVPRPLAALDGAWSHHGWGAHRWVEGWLAEAGDDPAWFRTAVADFHNAISGLTAPELLADRRDPWAHGDRVAWEGAEVTGSPDLVELTQHLLAELRPVTLPVQLVHGDLAGNVVVTPDGRPAVIDWPLYVRPTGWALAVVAADAVCWQAASPSLLRVWSDEPEWRQLLLRALVYRLATRGAIDPEDVDVDVEAAFAEEVVRLDD